MLKTFLIFMKMFSDPLFRGPLLGSLFMSLSMSIVGALAFVRKKSLLGEVLSHATFPGVAVGMVCGGLAFPFSDTMCYCFILLGAFIGALCGHTAIEKMILKRVHVDAALCYVLASFLGLGALCSSAMQQTHVLWFKKIQMFLYGQAATMTDGHIILYGVSSALIILFVAIFLRPLGVYSFDPLFSYALGIRKKVVEPLFLILLCLSIVVGLKGVGALMMTGMLVAPAASAKAFTRRFSTFILVSAFFGILSAFTGCFLSACAITFEDKRYLPLGPSIVASACVFAFLSLLFSPKEGAIIKIIRRWSFQNNCVRENLLKHCWKQTHHPTSFKSLKQKIGVPALLVFFSLYKLRKEGFLKKEKEGYLLTKDGHKKASYIVRLHRLWELYLIKYLSSEIEKVHQSAEEMEHLITPEIEEELTSLLENPRHDPHDQPIPQKELL